MTAKAMGRPGRVAPDLVAAVQAGVKACLPEVIALRRALHREPEIGLQTPATRAAVLARLASPAFRVRPPLLGDDLIIELPGAGPRTLCLRADMDALPIVEATGLPHASCRAGAMHACGHDGHTAILAGTARVLERLQHRLAATARFIFQPGEELVCGGRELVRRGACDGAEAAYALHGWSGLPAGCVSARVGPQLAAGGFFTLRLAGKGCHAAHPERGCNPIPCAGRLAGRLADYHAQVNAATGSVVSVCMLHAGEAANTIPGTATLQGTFRYLRVAEGDRLEAEIRAMAEAAAREAGVGLEVAFERSYALPVLNTAEGVARLETAARAGLPEGAWMPLEQPSMGNEDFAFYLEGREGAMGFLGLGQTWPALHTPAFDFNDAVLAPGITLLALVALGYAQA